MNLDMITLGFSDAPPLDGSGLGAIARFSSAFPCPVCGGTPNLPHGEDVRCWGGATTSGEFAWCVRRESPHYSAPMNGWRHRLRGECKCGAQHGFGAVVPPPPAPRVGPTRAPQPPALAPDIVNSVFTDYLALLPLRPEHQQHLQRRGDADLAVAIDLQYASLPLGHGAERAIIDTLLAKYGPWLCIPPSCTLSCQATPTRFGCPPTSWAVFGRCR